MSGGIYSTRETQKVSFLTQTLARASHVSLHFFLPTLHHAVGAVILGILEISTEWEAEEGNDKLRPECERRLREEVTWDQLSIRDVPANKPFPSIQSKCKHEQRYEWFYF